MSKVFIVNDHAHDFSPAKKYGELVAITEGRINPFNHHELFMEVAEKIKEADPDDFLLVCGNQALNIYCGFAWILQHKKIRLLIYDSLHNRYLIRDFTLWDMCRKLGKLGLDMNSFSDIWGSEQNV